MSTVLCVLPFLLTNCITGWVFLLAFVFLLLFALLRW